MKKLNKNTKKLYTLMSSTVFLNEPDYETSLLPKSKQYDEDLKTIAEWMVTHKEELTTILSKV